MSAPSESTSPRGPIVAIDGPAGSGKSTVARELAEALGVPHVDTGALYRAVTLACLRAGVGLDDDQSCGLVARGSAVERHDDRTFLDGEDVEDEIRGDAVTEGVSHVSALPGVREAMTPLQRAAAADGGVVEGRDIGTVVLPHADLKVFLTASPEERARRRAMQLGMDVTDAADLDDLVATLHTRDERDSTRDVAPLLRADDAWEFDTTGLDVEQVVARIAEEVVRARRTAPLRVRSQLPRIAVVGRPNVGKSTLVNRILGRRVAIVEEKPGVTRDRTEHLAEWEGRPFLVVDTGGWEHQAEGMNARIVEQAEAAIRSADLVLFVVDVTTGALEDDERYARVLRRAGVPVFLVANKSDSDRAELLSHELYGLGLGEAHAVSALHGRGLAELLDVAMAALEKRRGAGPDEVPDEAPVPRVALVGRPNVGKSSLFNRLLGEERSIVDDVPHTTRDAIDTMIEMDGEPWVFVDTAGMRRKYRTGEDTELYSVDRTRMAVEQADLVLFVIDGSEPLGEQDQRLAALLRDAGRGVILVINQWDEVDEERRADLEKELDRLLGFLAWAPRVNVSALTGRGTRRIMPTLREVWTEYQRRVPTRALNQWLEQVTQRTPPPTQAGRILRIRYMTQAETAPPRFVMFTNRPVPPAYRRFLERELRASFGFHGVPLHVGTPGEDRH